jgi:hypothetical protein
MPARIHRALACREVSARREDRLTLGGLHKILVRCEAAEAAKPAQRDPKPTPKWGPNGGKRTQTNPIELNVLE